MPFHFQNELISFVIFPEISSFCSLVCLLSGYKLNYGQYSSANFEWNETEITKIQDS